MSYCIDYETEYHDLRIPGELESRCLDLVNNYCDNEPPADTDRAVKRLVRAIETHRLPRMILFDSNQFDLRQDKIDRIIYG